jgi:DNA repair ATPase RecN
MEYSKELHKKARKIAVADSLTDKEVFALLDEIERLQTFEKAVDEWSKRVDAKLDNVTVKSNQVIQLMEHYRSECNRLQKLHEWIPVTTGLPEKYENFFVGGYNFTDHAYFNGDSWVSNTRTDCDGDGEWIIGVTHYQPLPLPPREQP